MTLATLAVGALVIALSFLVPVVMPKPAPPGSVAQVKLQALPGGKQRAAARRDTVSPDRRSRHHDRRSRATARRAAQSKASPKARSISRAEGVRRADATLPGPLPAADSPIGQPRNDSAPRAGGSPSPRTAPERDNPPPPDESTPRGDPVPVPAEPAEPPDLDATTAGADPPDEPEPAAGADAPDEPEPADGDPPIEAP
jgi:hypothetical protein